MSRPPGRGKREGFGTMFADVVCITVCAGILYAGGLAVSWLTGTGHAKAKP